MNNSIFRHFREIHGLSIYSLSHQTGLSVKTLLQVEELDGPIPPDLIKYYSIRFKVNPLYLSAIFLKTYKSNLNQKLVYCVRKIIFIYLGASKWLESFDEKR